MIITKELDIKINKGNITYYKKLGYDCKCKDIIKIKTEDITKGSNKIIEIQCDICYIKCRLNLNNYWRNYNNHGFYSCKVCSNEKRKMTFNERYGVEHQMYIVETKNKIKKTYLDKYGVNSYFKTDEFKEKSKETCFVNHGVNNYAESDEFKAYITEINMDKYGVESYFKTDEFKEKSKETCLINYGVEYPMQSDEIKNKVKFTSIKNGIQSSDISEFTKYRNRAGYLSRKNKYNLIEVWDGYDYYDGEYIKNYYDESCYSDKYPTIDHKISVLYGFKNNISAEEISHIDNLCITKRSINSKKGEKCYIDFIKEFNV